MTKPRFREGEMDSQWTDNDGSLAALRLQMLRFAVLQLKDETLAEDVVQDAFIGAMKNAGSFAGRSAFKTWVFAILKNKIADSVRKKARLKEISFAVDDDTSGDLEAHLFKRNGFWKVEERPADWGDPETNVLGKDFWRVFETCLDKLPDQQGRVFMMREFVDLNGHEICSAVGITTSNLNVLLYRARLRLRECLENNWFKPGDCTC